MKLYRVTLHSAGTEFLRQQLRGGDYLAAALLSLPLEDGETFTFLPNGVDLKDVSLEFGGVGSAELNIDLEEPTFELALRFQAASPSHIVLFELGVVQRDLPTPWRYRAFEVLTVDGSLHRIFQGQDNEEVLATESLYGVVRSPSKDEIEDLFRYARPFPTVGILTSVNDHQALLGRGDGDQGERFTRLAEATEYILVDAFDGEGYVVWSRQGVEVSPGA